jgi:membrane protein YdbS with pleckstrin-like domain
MDKLHPGARWVFRLRAYGALVFIGIFATIWVSGLIRFFVSGVGAVLIMVLLFYLLFVILIAEVYARMSYNRWKYEFTKDGLKLERGIIWKRYTNIPYQRVQNVEIHRGVIARMIGFSTVDIETAGYSGFGGAYMRFGNRRRYRSEGHIPALSKEGAEKTREFVMKKITKRGRNQGI